MFRLTRDEVCSRKLAITTVGACCTMMTDFIHSTRRTAADRRRVFWSWTSSSRLDLLLHKKNKKALWMHGWVALWFIQNNMHAMWRLTLIFKVYPAFSFTKEGGRYVNLWFLVELWNNKTVATGITSLILKSSFVHYVWGNGHKKVHHYGAKAISLAKTIFHSTAHLSTTVVPL